MEDLKLFVWCDGDEVYDYEAIAVVLAKNESQAFELLQDTDDVLYKEIKSIKPKVYESPNAFFVRGYPHVKKEPVEDVDWWQEASYYTRYHL
jgi:hypothetical protein